MLFTLDADGERFAIRRAEDGGTAYDWLKGPNKGYGFGSSGNGIGRWRSTGRASASSSP